jgi:hypothetical protein
VNLSQAVSIEDVTVRVDDAVDPGRAADLPIEGFARKVMQREQCANHGPYQP